MFGKGVYFADMMSKSANYCYTGLSNNTGLLLLAEVAVAPFNELTGAKYDADVDCKANNKLCVTNSLFCQRVVLERFEPPFWEC